MGEGRVNIEDPHDEWYSEPNITFSDWSHFSVHQEEVIRILKQRGYQGGPRAAIKYLNSIVGKENTREDLPGLIRFVSEAQIGIIESVLEEFKPRISASEEIVRLRLQQDFGERLEKMETEIRELRTSKEELESKYGKLRREYEDYKDRSFGALPRQ